MSISINCPECSARMSVADSMAGKSVKCPKCRTPMAVPRPGEDIEVETARDTPRPKRRARASEITIDDDRPRNKSGSGVMWAVVGVSLLFVFGVLTALFYYERSSARERAAAAPNLSAPPNFGGGMVPMQPVDPFQGWEDFSLPGSGFKGCFPNEPVQRRSSPTGTTYTTDSRALSLGVSCEVNILYAVPGGKTPFELEAEFRHLARGAAPIPSTLSGLLATEYVVENPNQRGSSIIRMLKTNTALYILILHDPNGTPSDDIRELFFDSFELLTDDDWPNVPVPDGWKAIAPPNGGFKTVMPRTANENVAVVIPREFTMPRTSTFGSMLVNGKTSCEVIVVVFPPTFSQPDRERLVANMVDSRLSGAYENSQSTLGGVKAQELRQTLNGGKNATVIRSVLIDNRAYIARITAGDDKEQRAFFGNFQFTTTNDRASQNPATYRVEKRFQIAFPDLWKFDTAFDEELKGLKLTGKHAVYVNDSQVEYHALHFDTPAGASAEEKSANEKVLTENITGIALGFKATNTQTLEIAGQQWVETTYTGATVNGKTPTRVVRRGKVKETTYIIAVCMPDQSPRFATRQFFDSFQFLK